jgi:hypothetical protein
LALKAVHEDVKPELIQILTALDVRETKKLHVVCTPSFYLDHFVQVDDLSTVCGQLRTKQEGVTFPALSKTCTQAGAP